jgi:branched-chain amino acid aminotransferase
MVSRGNKIWIDGTMTDGPDADRVSLLSHTLHYGVGAFEGIRAYRRASGESSVFRLDDHIVRLFNSCRLALLEPRVTVDQVSGACVDVLRSNNLDEAYLRPICFLGEGSMGLLPRDNPVITSVVACPRRQEHLGRGQPHRGAEVAAAS